MGQFSVEPFERLGLNPFFVTPDQVAYVFADILIGALIADVG